MFFFCVLDWGVLMLIVIVLRLGVCDVDWVGVLGEGVSFWEFLKIFLVVFVVVVDEWCLVCVRFWLDLCCCSEC